MEVETVMLNRTCSPSGSREGTVERARKAYIELAQMGVLVDDAALRLRGSISHSLLEADGMRLEVGIRHLAAATEELIDALNDISEKVAERERSKSPEVVRIRRAFDPVRPA